ncbi:MAG: hypothetical protein G01um101438_171 [Parcubacteria group bacterium Gr01-1014_38]|nr:MAG: hypothetical protein G01um101438_171 [Parcubacteria group bacterium Gr01-1014_38]
MRPLRLSIAVVTLLAFVTGVVALVRLPGWRMRTGGNAPEALSTPAASLVSPGSSAAPVAERVSFVGPREQIPDDAPSAYGFWSFAIPVSGVFSRSGQPLVSEFTWLKERGWKSVVNLRTDGERGEIGDDAKLQGFTNLGLTYLHIPLTDGQPPTEDQAEQFLWFVTNPENQPVHIHCRGGIGRTGTMTALYRYAVQGWPMDLAIQESRAFRGGVNARQATWLQLWAQKYPPESHVTPTD